MGIDRKHIVNLKGKDYPMWAGVLDAATREGLSSLTIKVVQMPTAENGNLAVVMARAEFKDGRVFEDVGDCSPASTKPHLASALLRLASTRAKGRACRDALNVGETMFEELPDNENTGREERHSEGTPAIICWENGCGCILTRDEILTSQKYPDVFEGRSFCVAHAKEIFALKRGPKPATA